MNHAIGNALDGLTTLAAVLTSAVCFASGWTAGDLLTAAAGVLLLQVEYLRVNAMKGQNDGHERKN